MKRKVKKALLKVAKSVRHTAKRYGVKVNLPLSLHVARILLADQGIFRKYNYNIFDSYDAWDILHDLTKRGVMKSCYHYDYDDNYYIQWIDDPNPFWDNVLKNIDPKYIDILRQNSDY